MFYRQLKRQLRKSEVLQSHTVDTGAQEIAAMLLAAALVAAERAQVADGQLPALRISFLVRFQGHPRWAAPAFPPNETTKPFSDTTGLARHPRLVGAVLANLLGLR